MEQLAIALALVLVFVLGLVTGARRAFNLMLTGQTLRTTNARIARGLPDHLPTRSAADILAGRVRVTLGDLTYDVPVLPRGAAKRWLERLDARFATLAVSLDATTIDTPEIMTRLVAEAESMYEMLLDFDQSHVLPTRAEADEVATDAQILQGLIEVWLAVHPKAEGDLPRAASTPPTPSSTPPTSSPSPMAGDPTISSPA